MMLTAIERLTTVITRPDFALLDASVFLCGVLFLFWLGSVRRDTRRPPSVVAACTLARFTHNPILTPHPGHEWENEAVFNPAAIVDRGRVHLFYRALGFDGISRIGYAWSDDGFNFTRVPDPVFAPDSCVPVRDVQTIASARYDRDMYASGGGWGGVEDPRAVRIGDRVYMSFSLFEHWGSIRMGVTSIEISDLISHTWTWASHRVISPQNETHKNWVLFPEKIHGKFAIIHALTPHSMIEYADSLDQWHEQPIKSNNRRGGRVGKWDSFVRGAAAPPIRTEKGWLLFYHGMDLTKPRIGYHVGAMLLDLEDPTIVRCRSDEPILSPMMPYENDWKPGVVYASGAVIKDNTLFVYYGGGDKTVNVATAPLDQFLSQLTGNVHIELDCTNTVVS